jgi:hypothetical protein
MVLMKKNCGVILWHARMVADLGDARVDGMGTHEM